MKKRITSLLLAFIMVLSLASSALAAPGETPPYSLKYLDGLEGSEYLFCDELDDNTLNSGEPVTQITMEAYDVLVPYLSANGDWSKIVAPFRKRFIDAGFDGWESNNSTYNEPEYYFENGTGDRFVIIGEKFSQSILNESGIVYIMHFYSTGYIREDAGPVVPVEGQPPYSLKYLDGIEGSEYFRYEDRKNDTTTVNEQPTTQMTIEGYDVLGLYSSASGDWSKIVAPFRKRFIDAGFKETVVTDEYGDDRYAYIDDSGHFFRILGETESQTIMNESGIVYILHDYYDPSASSDTTQPSGDTTQPTQPTQPTQTATPGLENFQKSRTYAAGQFADVDASAWYAPAVQSAYELGLVNGSGTGYAPTASISVAETLVLACRIHNIYNGGTGEFTQGSPWYQVYVDYADANGIISANTFTDYTASANRQVFALIMANALPESALPAINNITAENIPDSSSISASFLPAVLRLYNAGILTGSDAYGSFNPASDIKRSEVATIATRMAVSAERKAFTPQEKPAAEPETTTTTTPGTTTTTPASGSSLPASLEGIVPDNAPTTVLDSSATKVQLQQIYYSYMGITASAAGMQVRFAESCIKSGSRAWDNYMKYVAKGQGSSLTAMEYKTKAIEENTNMMRYLREAMPYLEAIEFGAKLCPDVFSRVGELASDTYNDIHHLAMSPDMSIAAIRLITVQGDLELLETAIDNAKAAIDAM